MKWHRTLPKVSALLYVLFSLLLVNSRVEAQRHLPGRFLNFQPDAGLKEKLSELKLKAYDVRLSLPPGYSKNGKVDYTDIIQSALNEHAVVLMPDFPVLINQKGLSANCNQTIIFNKHSQLIVKPNNEDTYEVIRIHNVENVSLYYPVIYGDKDNHIGSAGQWGMGIAVRASKNISIIRPQIFNCWGDGIYIGQINKKYSENIVITAPVLDGNRRNGLSITSAKNVKINKGVIAYSGPQMPMSGIDIEPNRNYDVIDSILIDGVVTMGHPKYGIVVSLQHLLGREVGSTNIEIRSHRDESSNIAFGIIGKPLNGTILGKIKLTQPVWAANKEAAVRLPFRLYGMGVVVEAPTIINSLKDNGLQKLREYLQNLPAIR